MPRSKSVLVVVVSLLGGACADDVPVQEGDARIAADELRDGVEVVIDGDLGRVDLPFEQPVPQVDDAELEAEMEQAVSLFIASEISGAAADLAAGSLVAGDPAASGEFSWQLNEDRDLATLTFFNRSPGGLTFTPGRPYRAQLSVTRNRYVSSLPTVAFAVTVVEAGG